MKNVFEKKVDLKVSDLAKIGILRSTAGIGIGFLLSELVGRKKRRQIGWFLLLGSIAVGVPVAVNMLEKIFKNEQMKK